MRISELSRISDTPIPSIKFYLREKLLQPGEATSANQASYGEAHVTRLRFIRALIDVGGLSVASARTILGAVDTPDLPLSHVFGTAQHQISQSDLYSRPSSDAGRARVDAVVARHAWHVSVDNPGRIGAANVIDSFAAIGHPELLDLIDEYADAAEQVARADLALVGRQADVAAMAETVVAGTVLGDAIFAALRRMAQEHVTSELFPTTDPNSTADPYPAADPNPTADPDPTPGRSTS